MTNITPEEKTYTITQGTDPNTYHQGVVDRALQAPHSPLEQVQFFWERIVVPPKNGWEIVDFVCRSICSCALVVILSQWAVLTAWTHGVIEWVLIPSAIALLALTFFLVVVPRLVPSIALWIYSQGFFCFFLLVFFAIALR